MSICAVTGILLPWSIARDIFKDSLFILEGARQIFFEYDEIGLCYWSVAAGVLVGLKQKLVVRERCCKRAFMTNEEGEPLLENIT